MGESPASVPFPSRSNKGPPAVHSNFRPVPFRSLSVPHCLLSIAPKTKKARGARTPSHHAPPTHLLCPRDLGHTPTLSHAIHVRIVQMDYDLKNLYPPKYLTNWEDKLRNNPDKQSVGPRITRKRESGDELSTDSDRFTQIALRNIPVSACFRFLSHPFPICGNL